MSDLREYIVEVPIHGTTTYVVLARNGQEAMRKVNDQRAGDNDDIEITWVGRARNPVETRASRESREEAS